MKEQKIDARTREYLRKWGPREVPTAQVTGGEVSPGMYRSVPCLGWIERQGPLAVCGVHFLLMRNQEFRPIATLSLAMPVTKNTELHVNSFLHALNWDGRVWPYDGDKGWPENSEEDCENIKGLLGKLATRVGSTLTFPPSDLGASMLRLNVVKRSSPYPLAPFEPLPEEIETSPVIHLARFRELCKDPSPFAPLN